MCCTSLRGAAFFGASLHIAVGFILFSRYVIATVVFTFYNFNDLFSERVTAFLAPFMIYVTLLLALGILIFHSVEKEYFFLLKWSSVAFSLLQLAVFVTILLLKLSPNYHYHQFPFLPDSLTNGFPPSPSSSESPPAGPGTGILTVPHGSILTERDKSNKSSDPPDPGGGGGGLGESDIRWREGLLLEIQRLSILISCVLLTLVYLLFLFLYIRQLNYEDTGHVFGHAQAITRNIAFYVQPQFTGSQGNTDNNKLGGQVQRSQTQIPQQFLPQQTGPQVNQSPKKVPPLQQNQVQVQSSAQPSITTTSGVAGNPGELAEVQRSPARSQRGGQQQQQQQLQDRSNPQNLQMTVHNQTQGTFPPGIPQSKVGVGPSAGQPLPLARGGGGGGGGGVIQGGIQIVDSPAGQVHNVLGQRGPIPAQVRIGFFPKDLEGINSPVGLPHNNIRPRGVPGGVVEPELRGQQHHQHQHQEFPHQNPQQQQHHPQQIQQHPHQQSLPHQYQPQQPHPHPQGQHLHGPHPMQQQQQHSHGPQQGHHVVQHHGPPHSLGPHPMQQQQQQHSHSTGPHPPGAQHSQGQPHHPQQGLHLTGQHGHPPQFQRLQYHGNQPHQQQLLHHSYPNQSDSASPASSVAYSPNPPPRGKHPISMV